MIESQITLRDAMPADRQFLARLYEDTRRQEISAWGWPTEQQEQFLRTQFDAQYRWYRAGFPDASDRIICAEEAAVGRILTALESGGMRLIDIALLEEHRNRGIGGKLLCQLQQDCTTRGCALCLQVLQGNPAIRLYQRLGFERSGMDPMYVQMEWLPSPDAERT
jgi:GNAT superfamily N-acetyltransferase